MSTIEKEKVKEYVRDRYGKIAKENSSCCTTEKTSCCDSKSIDELSEKMGYSLKEITDTPDGSNMGLGCGNPISRAGIKKGDIVLDLGCGGGFDCFLASKQVGKEGKVIGVDMTAEMISKARSNAEKAGYTNIEFRLGEIENLPIADGIADVIISNCVINLSPDKKKVYEEAFRVLKPGGRISISDIVAIAEMPNEVRSDLALYAGCVAGAITIDELKSILKESGFKDIRITARDESRELINDWVPSGSVEDYVASAIIEAVKPV